MRASIEFQLWVTMATEAEVISLQQGLLRQAIECCVTLKKLAGEPKPYGSTYTKLQRILKQLEGSCRQMSHERGDTRFLKPGVFFGKCTRLVQRSAQRRNWAAFDSFEKIFEKAMLTLDELTNRRTERRSSLILPANAASWLADDRLSSAWLDVPRLEDLPQLLRITVAAPKAIQ